MRASSCRTLAPLLLAAAPAAAIRGLPKGFEIPATVKDHFKHWTPEGWTIKHRGGAQKDGINVTTTTYTSPVIELMTGESAFTLNPSTHIPFPEGDYTILRADFQLVDATGNTAVPLSEVYNHHWLIGTSTSVNPLDSCEDNLFFGAGAEMKGMPTVYPKGTGNIRVGASGTCGGNLHFIRTEDLATNWTGMNDPKGSYGAAVKNCIECGFAPKRSPECIKMLDGTYACCLGGARCPVNHPEDTSTKAYHLQYEVQWTRNLTAVALLGGGVLDLSADNGIIDGLAEWNIAPNAKTLKDQVCNDTVCNATNTWTVDEQKGFGDGICPGEMMWSYLHQHIGAISGTMKINGEEICSSYPVVGTDPANPVGNEKGYVVAFTPCIDRDNNWNASTSVKKSIRINKGDEITITALYSVDKDDTTFLPFPGGKHGGVMGLYFYEMVCDAGTFLTDYSCRQGACIPVVPGKGDYKDLASCQAAVGGSGVCPSGPAKYRCVNGACVEDASGVDRDTCQAAC